ncbi:hypothetical protein ACOME3_009108 [Neoechinorhynchus agilis]
MPICQPSEWPSLSFANNTDEAFIFKCLRGLLLQALISCYMALFTYSVTFYDAIRLNRLIGKRWDSSLWCRLFGCGEQNMRFVGPSHKICAYFLLPASSEQQTGTDLGQEVNLLSGTNNSVMIESTELGSMLSETPAICQEHMDTESFGWALIRYNLLLQTKANIDRMVDLCELTYTSSGCLSSNVSTVMKTLRGWIRQSQSFVKQTSATTGYTGCIPTELFCSHTHSKAVRDLWGTILNSEDSVAKKILHNRKVFSSNDNPSQSYTENVKVESFENSDLSINSFVLNKYNHAKALVATSTNLVESYSTNEKTETYPVDDVVTWSDEEQFNSFSFTDRKCPRHRKVKKEIKIGNACALASSYHNEFLYSIGCTDGSTFLLSTENNPKVNLISSGDKGGGGGSYSHAITSISFNGANRIALTNLSGQLELYRIDNLTRQSYYRLKSHTKHAYGICSIGLSKRCSSIFATCGASSDSRNVSLWDTLLPPRCACATSFHCHESGCLCLTYSPIHNILITGGKKGDITVFDIRQRRKLHHTHQQSSSPITHIALNTLESVYATGAHDGSLKLWSTSNHETMLSINTTQKEVKLNQNNAGLTHILKSKGCVNGRGIGDLEFVDAENLMYNTYDGALKYFHASLNDMF